MSLVLSILAAVDGRSRAMSRAPSTSRLSVVAVAVGIATAPERAGQSAVRPGSRMIPKEPTNATRSMDFPQFPGEEVYSHAAALFLEKAEARLASLGLLAAAEGRRAR